MEPSLTDSVHKYEENVLELLRKYSSGRGDKYWVHPVTGEPQSISFDDVRVEVRGEDRIFVVEFHERQRNETRYLYEFCYSNVLNPEINELLDDEFLAAGILTEIDERIEAASRGGLPILPVGVKGTIRIGRGDMR
jgi:hypothetical protein